MAQRCLRAEKRKLQMLQKLAENQSTSSSVIEPLLRQELVEAQNRFQTFESRARGRDEHLAQLQAEHEARAWDNSLTDARSNWELRAELEATQARLCETQTAATALRDMVVHGSFPTDSGQDMNEDMYEDAWGHEETVVLKTLRIEREFLDEYYELHRRDALAMERLEKTIHHLE